MSVGKICNYVIEGLIYSMLIFSPLAFGSVEILPLTILESVSFLILFIWLVKFLVTQELQIGKRFFWLPIVFFILLVVFQLTPQPKALLGLLSAKHLYIFTTFIPNEVISKVQYCLTVCKDLTISKLIELLSFTAVFFVLLNSLETKKQFKRIVIIIISIGFFVSVLGMAKNFAYPFINKNHFAGYLEMVIFMTIGLLLTELDRQKRVIFSFIAITMIFTLFLSLSRAGLLSFFISLLVMFCLLRLRKAIRKKTVLIAVLVIFAFLFMFISGADPFLTRISTLFNKEAISIESRWVIWKDMLKIIYDFPIFGSGLGTFKSIYPMYKTLTGQVVISQAHNDLLQLISETGLLGMGLTLWFFWLFFKNIFEVWLFRHHPFAKGITLGGACAIFSILLHSFFDFNLQIPANSFLFMVIMAVTYGSVFVEYKNENEIAKAHNNI